jgi:hypothetical protein
MFPLVVTILETAPTIVLGGLPGILEVTSDLQLLAAMVTRERHQLTVLLAGHTLPPRQNAQMPVQTAIPQRGDIPLRVGHQRRRATGVIVRDATTRKVTQWENGQKADEHPYGKIIRQIC